MWKKIGTKPKNRKNRDIRLFSSEFLSSKLSGHLVSNFAETENEKQSDLMPVGSNRLRLLA